MYPITRRLFALATTLLLVVAVSACTESKLPQATGKGIVRGVNAIVTAPELRFLIEERSVGTINYKDVSAFNAFDDLTYNFNFDLRVAGQLEDDRLATEFIDVIADHEYTVVITGSIANPSSLFWEDPVRAWSESDTVSEVFFAHLASQIGELDVYFAVPGTVPVLGQAVGTLAFGERLPARDFEEAQYELILTPKDDPATITFQSVPVDAVARTRATLAIFDPDPTLPGNLGVNLLDDSAGSDLLADVRFPSQLRILHAAFGTENVDGYLDGNFSNLVYPDVAFLGLSQYADAVNSSTLLTVTAVANSGAALLESSLGIAEGTKNTAVLTGEPGGLTFLPLRNGARPLETFPTLRIVHASFNTDAIDVYFLEPGTPIEDAIIPLYQGLPPLFSSGFGRVAEGARELTITLRGETTPISVPVIIDLAIGQSADAVIVDTVDPAVVELVVFDLQ